MPTSLRNRLNELASAFASSVLGAIRSASVDELLGEPSVGVARSAPRAAAPAGGGGRRRGGRLPRRSAGDIADVIERIVALLRDKSGGLRAEQIREQLGLQAKELPRPLKEALDTGRLGKSGQKRATTYFVKGPGASARGRAATGARRAGSAGSRGRKSGGGRGAKRRAESKEAPTNASTPA